jgi:osmotically inducible protein OsmC
VPRVQRSADVTWQGNVARGFGALSARSGAFDGLPYSLPSRIGASEGKTSPEELLAAAHAGCYAMGLAGELAQAGTPVDRLEVTATVTLDEVEGGSHQIVASELRGRVRADGLDAAALARAAGAADEGCPFSSLIKRSGTVTVNVELEGGANGD